MRKFSVATRLSIIALPFLVNTGKANALFQDDSSVKLHSAVNGTVEDLGGKTNQPITGGNDLELKLAAPMEVRLDGRIPVILIPIQAGVSQVNLNPPLYKDVTAAPKQKEIADSLTDIMINITAIQKDIQKHDVDTASRKLDDLRKRYPDVDFLDFVAGSILLLKGDKDAARKTVSRALEAHPDFKDGQDFLKALGGTAVPTSAKGKKGE